MKCEWFWRSFSILFVLAAFADSQAARPARASQALCHEWAVLKALGNQQETVEFFFIMPQNFNGNIYKSSFLLEWWNK